MNLRHAFAISEKLKFVLLAGNAFIRLVNGQLLVAAFPKANKCI